MKNIIALAAALLLPAFPAGAVEFDPLIWSAMDRVCATGVLDTPLSDKERVDVCASLVVMERELSAGGYCWSAEAHTWEVCKD